MSWFDNDNVQIEHNKKIDYFLDESNYEDNIEVGLNDNKTIKKAEKTKLKINDIRVIEKLKKEKLKEVINELPKENEYFHIVSNGTFDYFNMITRILELDKSNFEFVGSTWTMNYKNIETLFNYYDLGRLTKLTVICGEYLKQREPLVYQTLKEGMIERNQKLKSFNNHSKIILLGNTNNQYVLEGSANWTANPRVEQNIILNNKQVYEFHKKWIGELFNEME